MPFVANGLVKRLIQPRRNLRAAGQCEFARADPVFNRQNAGDDRRVDPCRRTGIAEAEKGLCFKEELRDRLGRACVNLALEPVDVGLLIRSLGVLFRVGANADCELAGVGQGRNQLAAIGKALRVRHKPVRALGRVAAQGDNLGHASGGELVGNLQRLGAAGIDAGQMRRHIEAGGLVQGAHRLAGQFAGGAARAIGHGHKPWVERRKRVDRLPQAKRGLKRLGREEFKRDTRRCHLGSSCAGVKSVVPLLQVQQCETTSLNSWFE